jgi:hypothetical protein
MRKIQPLLIILEKKTLEQPHTYSSTKMSGNSATKMPSKRNRPLKLLGQKSPERNGSMRKIQPLLIILEKKTSEQPHTYFWTKRSANSWTKMPLKRNLPLKLLGQKSPERND